MTERRAEPIYRDLASQLPDDDVLPAETAVVPLFETHASCVDLVASAGASAA